MKTRQGRGHSVEAGTGTGEDGRGDDTWASADALLELADAWGRESSPERVERLAQRARDRLASAGHTVETAVLVWHAQQDGGRRTEGHSGALAARLQGVEIDRGEGPTLDTLQTGTALNETFVDGTSTRWPRFSEEAACAGVCQVASLPLHHRGRTLGALVIYLLDERPLFRGDHIAARNLVDACAVGLAAQDLLRRNGQLQHALDSRVVIEQAKGILSERRQCSPEEAFGMLRSHARSRRRPLQTVAREVVEGTPEEPPSGPASAA